MLGAGSGHITCLPLHNSLINNMCYQFPLGLQNPRAGDRALLPSPGGCGGDGAPHLPAVPCPLLKLLAMGSARLQRVPGRPQPGSVHREEVSEQGPQH